MKYRLFWYTGGHSWDRNARYIWARTESKVLCGGGQCRHYEPRDVYFETPMEASVHVEALNRRDDA